MPHRFGQIRHGYAILETLIVVAILTVLAATVVPQYQDVTNNGKFSTTLFSLQEMRAQIEVYRSEHQGVPPEHLSHLTLTSEENGATPGPLGPYLDQIPTESIHNVSTVTSSLSSPIKVSETTGGWIYNPSSGELRINHTDYSSL